MHRADGGASLHGRVQGLESFSGLRGSGSKGYGWSSSMQQDPRDGQHNPILGLWGIYRGYIEILENRMETIINHNSVYVKVTIEVQGFKSFFGLRDVELERLSM